MYINLIKINLESKKKLYLDIDEDWYAKNCVNDLSVNKFVNLKK